MLNVLIKNILSLQKSYRNIILIILDIFFITASLSFSRLILKDNQLLIINNLEIFIFAFILVIIYSFTSIYKSLTRYTEGSTFVYKLAIKNIIILTLLISLKEIALNITWKYIFLSWLLITVSISIYRIIVRDILLELQKKQKNRNTNKKRRIAIFGAGIKSYQIYNSLNLSEKYELKYFIDEDSSLSGNYIFRKKIISFSDFENYYHDIEQVFVSLSSLNNLKNKRLISKLKALNIEVMVIPSIDDIGLDISLVDKLRPISINDLLGRSMVLPDKKLLKKGVEQFVIFITGAGGSIGSQLAKDISLLEPKELILIDNSEFNLYKIEQDILNIKNLNIKISSYLGNVCDEELVKSIFKKHSVDIVFHTAAYKHVPLVEKNPIVGIENNLLSTINICEAAKINSIKKVIFISSDKSVRPSNIMGASKRLSEMVIQSYAQDENSSNTCYSMVRFGNVLGSSGSVIPLFKKQISEGGPVTVTHPDVVRYFMTVKEASQLVIQASTLAKGGEVFLLDMGKPINIADLAEQIINLSGKKLKNKNNPDGDIEIKFIGLRNGEKLYEELLIDSKSIPTNHPLIFYGNESFMGNDDFLNLLKKLKIALKEKNIDKTLIFLSKLVPDWHSS